MVRLLLHISFPLQTELRYGIHEQEVPESVGTADQAEPAMTHPQVFCRRTLHCEKVPLSSSRPKGHVQCVKSQTILC